MRPWPPKLGLQYRETRILWIILEILTRWWVSSTRDHYAGEAVWEIVFAKAAEDALFLDDENTLRGSDL